MKQTRERIDNTRFHVTSIQDGIAFIRDTRRNHPHVEIWKKQNDAEGYVLDICGAGYIYQRLITAER